LGGVETSKDWFKGWREIRVVGWVIENPKRLDKKTLIKDLTLGRGYIFQGIKKDLIIKRRSGGIG
jgi:hypothetical protein